MKATTSIPIAMAFVSCAAFAQPAPPDTGAPVQRQTQNGVNYMCGGVGLDESTYMKQVSRDFALSLTFAAQNGAYLADVAVSIADGRGNTVFQTTCKAPMLLVDLPRAGTYRVHAETGGYAMDRTVRVGRTGIARAVMVWPQRAAGSDDTALAQPR